jgi:nitrate reductase NapAB chaperone NapD
MPVLGLVVVMDDPNESTRQRVATALAQADDLELGVAAAHRWPVVLEADSPDQAESRIAALRALPGIAAIDVVYADFEDLLTPASTVGVQGEA